MALPSANVSVVTTTSKEGESECEDDSEADDGSETNPYAAIHLDKRYVEICVLATCVISCSYTGWRPFTCYSAFKAANSE